MRAKAMVESKRGSLVRAFLLDLELEYSRAHRDAFQAYWGLDARPQLVEGDVAQLIDEGLVYARKWFGAGAVDDVSHELRQAA